MNHFPPIRIDPGAASLFQTIDHNITAVTDKDFIDFAKEDFHLVSNSQLIDVGAVTTGLDYDGNIRPQKFAPDIGAFEFLEPPVDCSLKTLGLQTTALTEPQARELMLKEFGPNSWVGDRLYNDGRRYTVKVVGILDYKFGFTTKPEHKILGEDDRGSYRRAFNNAVVERCKTKYNTYK